MNKISNFAYEKMPDSLKKLKLSAADYAQMDKLRWVVTEKIHGANFSFIYENQQIRFAKRKAYLSWEDDFFGFQAVVQKLEHSIMSLFETLSRDFEGDQYIIYGELFGGAYPHPEVEQNEQVQAIQTGIYYTPAIDFCAFDIAIVKVETDEKYYLDYADAIHYFESHGLLHAQILSEGSLNEVLEFDIKIDSTMPKKWDLPPLSNNLIEGIVIKPLTHLRLPVGKQVLNLPYRPIIKIKNPEFEETQKYHQAQKWSYIPEAISHSEDLDFLVEALREYVTVNRLQSAISKIGALNANNQEFILDEFLTDIWIDFNEENNDILKELNSEQQNWVKERLKAAIRQLVSAFI